MEPVLIILIPGLFGGVILATLIATKRINLRTPGVDRQLTPPSPSLINMAHIRVEGGGGLGLVAAVIAVALADSRIRVAIGIAALLGVIFAAILIARRRDHGRLISGGDDSGPHPILGLDRDPNPAGAQAPAVRETVSNPVGPSRPGRLRLAAGH
jgi:hypothetical protein